MDVDKKDEELLFTECKESVDDIFGWKIVIFLPQSTAWKVFMMITISISFIITTIVVFYRHTNEIFYAFNIICDSIYFVDALCATLHFSMTKVRNLRHGKRRHIVFLLIDYFSLIPLHLLFQYFIYNKAAKLKQLRYILRANAALRCYQIPLAFSDIKKEVSKIKTYYIITFLEVFTYFGLITHFFSCILNEYFDENYRKKCRENFVFCIVENDLLTFMLLDHNYISPISGGYPLKDYKILLMVEFIFGFIFTYAFITPLVIYVNFALLKKVFKYSYKRQQLSLLAKNMIEEKVLKRKLTDYFHYAWTYGKGNNLPEIINLFPLSFKKTIFCDMYWEALRHSEFLRDLSIGCKRSLSLHMTTNFVLPKTVLFENQELKTYFMYLESGLIQVLTEENNESSVLNLSGGTVLGEISFFYQTESKSVLRTGKFSIVHILKFENLCRVLLHYPKDKKKIYHKMKVRMKIAKAVQKNKTEIYPLFLHNPKLMQKTSSKVKWLKQQYRALLKLDSLREHEVSSSMRQSQEASINTRREIPFLQTQLDHSSLYLPLLCINDEVEKAYDIVCVKGSFPWLLDPNCHFLSVWNLLNSAAVVFVLILYPAFLGWYAFIPPWFCNVAVVINLIYIIDVVIQLFTAVKIKGVVIHKFSTVLIQRFESLGFILDLLAALPLYLLYYFHKSLQSSFKLNLLLSNTLLKSYKLLPVLNKLSYSPRQGIYHRATIKYALIMYFSAYWSAAILQLMGVECIFYECGENDWLPSNLPIVRGENYSTFVSIFVALYMVLDVPIKNVYTDEHPSFIVYLVLYIISNFLYYAWQGECVACYVLEHNQELEYRNLMGYVRKFMLQHRVSNMLSKRVMAMLEFQWLYDKGNYITQKRRILEDLSKDLRDEVDKKFLLPIIQKSRLFKWESDQFFVDLCRKASRFALPAHSLLMTFGTQAMTLYVIHKGHVQVNSFITGDSRLDISTPLVFKSGDTFPVLVAFSQIPSPISAITLTDCELLTLDLEDILTTMILHKMLPDVVKALQELDLTPMSTARRGLSRIKSSYAFDQKAYDEPFNRLKFFGTFLKLIFIKKGINFRNRAYLCWEISRNVLIFINLIVWPLVFGCSSKWDHILYLIITLVSVDCISSLVDFYVRLHVAYYNNKGIYVWHPLATFVRYLTSSFLLDLLAFVPNIHMICLLIKERLNFSLSVVVVHTLLRSLSIYRITGLSSYSFYAFRKQLNLTKLIKCIFFGLLAVHYYINFMAYLYLNGKAQVEMSFSLERRVLPKKPHEFYFFEFALIASILLQGQIFLKTYSIYNLVRIAVLGTMAVLYQTFIFSVLTLSMTSSRTNFTVYQYYFRSFVKYLNEERVEDSISSQAIKHFQFQWQRFKGINMKRILSSFPYTLHEDILFPLYKDTLSSVRCLSMANEAFYRILSRNVQVVALMASSVIIFQNQAQEDIFFIHKGKCLVEENSKILTKGAVIGDIRLQGLMKHTVKAVTHVDLLKIPSKLFFLIMGNFYNTKKAFESEAAAADDFLESIYIAKESSAVQMELLSNEEFLEAEFEIVNHDLKNLARKTLKVKKKKTVVTPDSPTMRVLDFVFFVDAYITFLVIPIFIGITLLTSWALVIIYCLDIIWIVKIILSMRTTFLDPKTGKYVYNNKIVFYNYLQKLDGLVLHVLSVLPIELIVVAYYGKSAFSQHCHIVYYCYSNRLFRVPHIHYYINSRMNDMLANIYLKLLNFLIFGIVMVNLFVGLNLLVRRGKEYKNVECHWGAQKSQLDDIKQSYFSMLNHFSASGISVDMPETALEISFEMLIEVLSLLSKGVVVTQVLIIIYVTHFTKLDRLLKLQQLEKYLSIRNISPALIEKIQKYSCYLLNAYKEDAHPSFLKEAPFFIRANIMQDVYMHHLSDSNIFNGIDDIFLKQLVVRLERFIFFPGDYIVEKGDVDQNMYFIHKGEVKCVEIDKRYPVLERTVDLYVAGESFGIMQGLLLSCPHANTFRAKVLTDILVLNYNNWRDLRVAFPAITERIYKKFRQMNAKV